MSKLDPKIILVSAAALVAVGALGFAVARQMPPEESAPLAVVTLDRVSEQAAEGAKAELAELGAELVALGAERDDLAAQLAAMTAERDRTLEALELARAEPPDPSGEAAVVPSELMSELAAATGERDALAGELEALRAEVAAQTAALEAAADETEALKQALGEAEAEAQRQAAAAEASRQQTEQAAAPAAPAASAFETVESEVPSAPSLTSAEIEEAVEQGLRAYQAKDFNTAFETWQPLADQGVARAQFYVGALYRDGAGVNRDVVQAYIWLRRSDARGYIYAKGLLDRVSKEMNSEQLAQAQAILSGQ